MSTPLTSPLNFWRVTPDPIDACAASGCLTCRRLRQTPHAPHRVAPTGPRPCTLCTYGTEDVDGPHTCSACHGTGVVPR